MTTGRTLGMIGALLAAAAAPGQDPKAATGANPGDLVPASFRMFLVTDDRFPLKSPPAAGEKVKPENRDPKDRTGKIHCLVCEHGLSPVVAVFVRADPKTLGPDAGVVKLARRMNGLVKDYRGDKLAGFVGFLREEGPPKAVAVDGATVELDGEYPDDENRDEHARQVADLAKAADAAKIPFGLAPRQSKADDAWGLKPGDAVTVVFYNRLKVVNRWTFPADGPTDAQVKEIADAVAATLGGAKK